MDVPRGEMSKTIWSVGLGFGHRQLSAGVGQQRKTKNTAETARQVHIIMEVWMMI
jgi:hypothetical protein